MSEPIREALEKAAGAALSELSDRKGIGNELEQCDDETKAEIGRTVAAKAIAAFITALHKDGITTIADGNFPWMGDYVLAIAKEEQ